MIRLGVSVYAICRALCLLQLSNGGLYGNERPDPANTWDPKQPYLICWVMSRVDEYTVSPAPAVC